MVTGEFWIVDGSAIAADGDTGDYNHEGVAIDAILANHDIDDYDTFDNMSIDELVERGFNQDEIDAIDFNGRGDPREYVTNNYGWKRLLGNEIETFTLTKSDLDDIADGLYDAYGDQVENESFNIEVRANQQYYLSVPWQVISDGDFGTLLMHKT